MPELPDLQAFGTNLSRKLTGKVVEKIHAINRKKLKTAEGEFQKALKGKLYLVDKKNEEKFTIIEIYFTDRTRLALTDFQGQAQVTRTSGLPENP